MLAALLVTSLPARAADLELSIGVPFRDPVEVTLHDVDEGAVPGLVLPGVDGTRYTLSIELTELEDAYRLSLLIEGAEPTRAGRTRTWTVSHSALVVGPDVLARIDQGPSGEDGADHIVIEALVHPTDG